MKAELKSLENEYDRLLVLYTKERQPKTLVMDPKEEMPEVIVDEKVAVEDIDYKVVEQEDPTLPAGVRKVKVAGQKGQERIKTTKFIVNGEVLDTKVDETVLRDAVDEIVLVGTKKVTTLVYPPKNPKGGKDGTSKDGINLLGNGGSQTPNGQTTVARNTATPGQTLPNTGDNSRVARQLALGGYGLLASLGLAGVVAKRKRGE